MEGQQTNSGVEDEHFYILVCSQFTNHPTNGRYIMSAKKASLNKESMTITIKQQTHILCIYTHYIKTLKTLTVSTSIGIIIREYMHQKMLYNTFL
jgi:hypothetical protein